MMSMNLRKILSLSRSVAGYLAAGLVGCLLVASYALVTALNGRPELSVWHVVDLDEEYRAGSKVTDFEQYLALEDRLFSQLDSLVYAKVSGGPENAVNRYSRGSLSDPQRWSINWNRSFQLGQENPMAGVLLLHGLSDSPYSLRQLGEGLHRQGAMVLGLRIPGHGTAPSGLLELGWRDMAAAVRLAARHVRDEIGDKPFYVVGYSNGGALAVEYALASLKDSSLPRLSGVILLSPEIGIAGAAALAVWQGRLGHLLGLEKLAWNSILPEYDPFKYNSFAVNAGDLAHQITRHIQGELKAMQGTARLDQMPPILAFQSGADSTVTASALVENLFDRLPPANHELVLFDINRRAEVGILLKQDPRAVFEPLLKVSKRHFDLTVVSNESSASDRVVARTTLRHERAPSSVAFLNHWPAGVYSLSHVALPFAPGDPVYGGPGAEHSPGIQLGNLALRGERGVLLVSGADTLRLRWNPFFEYVQQRVFRFTGLEKFENAVGPAVLQDESTGLESALR
jgi:alpha-beta hydrolase superfamily lysophospholipase